MKKRRRTKSRRTSSSSWTPVAPSRSTLAATLTVLLILGVTLVALLGRISQPQYQRGFAGSCNDNNCQNARNGAYWMITNCDAPDDPDGDQQLCDRTGRIGTCQSRDYCCPASGQQWTTDMSACPTPTPAQTPTPGPTNTPTPNPTPTATPVPTSTPTPTPTVVVTNTPTPTKKPTATPKPTPTAYISQGYCNEPCTSNASCKSGLTCTTTALGKICRNALCSDKISCVCPAAKGIDRSQLVYLGTTPTPTPVPEIPELTVTPFTGENKKASSKFTLSGTATPYTILEIFITPDGVSQQVQADANGNWRFILTKPLEAGKKELKIVATSPTGGTATYTDSFTVPAASRLGSILLVGLVVILIVGGVGFVLANR